MNLKKTWKRANDGFTLVELIVVIAILAILAGIAVPAYSGYIKKANEAADYQVLAAVNTAFAAAAMDADGISISEKPDGSYSFNVASMTPSAYKEEFALYYGGGADSFKVITALTFKGGQFVKLEMSTGMSNLLNILTGSDNAANMEALMQSGFMTYEGLGINDVTDKIDYVAGLAGALAYDNQNSTISQILFSKQPEMLTALGFDVENWTEADEEAFAEKWESMVAARAEMVDTSNITGYNEMTAEEQAAAKKQLAATEIYANNMVLQVANTAKNEDSQATLNRLSQTENFTDLLKDTDGGFADAAMAYGLYTAYAHSLEGTARDEAIAKANDPVSLLKSMDDPGFKTYLSNSDGKAQADLEGFMASMDMMTQAQDDPAAVENILVNGFNNDELLAVLNQATASQK